MSSDFIAGIISTLANLFILLIIIDTVLSYFLDPYHPLRSALDRIISPFLGAIRRVVPPLGILDLSPLILIILVEILSSILIRLL